VANAHICIETYCQSEIQEKSQNLSRGNHSPSAEYVLSQIKIGGWQELMMKRRQVKKAFQTKQNRRETEKNNGGKDGRLEKWTA
jgi:hypothetical protein